MDILKVSNKSNPNSVAGALVAVVKEKGTTGLQAIGAGALNQAIKAVAIAVEFGKTSNIELVCIPKFIDIVIDEENRTAVLLVVEPR